MVNHIEDLGGLCLRVLANLGNEDKVNLGRELASASKCFRELVWQSPQFVRAALVQPDQEELDMSDESEFMGDLGLKGEFACTQKLKASIFLPGKKIGTVSMTLIDRNSAENFHEACDAESQELQEVGVDFCNSRGLPRLKCVQQAGRSARDGGFLYIDSFRLDNPADDTTAGAIALRSLLLAKPLSGRWPLAVYIPEAEAQMSHEERRRRHQAVIAARRSGEETASVCQTGDDHLVQRDAHQFIRAGSRQAIELVQKSGCYHFFALLFFLASPMASHEQAVNTRIVEKRQAEATKPDGINSSLTKFLMKALAESCSNDEQQLKIQRKIAGFIDKGATIEGANALHCCAANNSISLLEFLLQLTRCPSEAVNGMDFQGVTPLMLAAERAGTDLSEKGFACCRKLIELGAKKGITDMEGRTALGRMRLAQRNMADFQRVFGRGSHGAPQKIAVESLELLLMPPGGGSSSDNALGNDECMQEEDSEEDIDFEDDPEFEFARMMDLLNVRQSAAHQGANMAGVTGTDGIIEEIHHEDPPATRDEELSRLQAEEEWADAVERRIAAASRDMAHAEVRESIYVHRYGCGDTEAFRQLLLNGREFSEVRDALGKAGHSCVHASGALLLVRPCHVDAVLNAAMRQELRPYHVIVSESFEQIIEQIRMGMPSKKRPRLREERQELVDDSSEHSADDDSITARPFMPDFLPLRTFLCMAPDLRAAETVNQSTTEATTDASSFHYSHYRGLNPRRFV
eukprot:TRINITY_DN12742_c0_g1_i1.p1 TRINITY_DN12742_c0_g1~~TRINITY_DN12742_c0_g1_i1.p1  ORF type:complete len:747 (+),score=132.27 TRINITY_DN12742_c0_g1_i1:132-2372(+)